MYFISKCVNTNLEIRPISKIEQETCPMIQVALIIGNVSIFIMRVCNTIFTFIS